MEIRLISITKNHIYWYTPNLFKMCSVRKRLFPQKAWGILHILFLLGDQPILRTLRIPVMLQKTNLILPFPTLFEQFEHVSPNFPARENLSKLFLEDLCRMSVWEMISYTRKYLVSAVKFTLCDFSYT